MNLYVITIIGAIKNGGTHIDVSLVGSVSEAEAMRAGTERNEKEYPDYEITDIGALLVSHELMLSILQPKEETA